MFVLKKKYEKLRREYEDLARENDRLLVEIAEAESNVHKTTPLCKGCVNCIETGVGYFSNGLQFDEYACKLNRTCKDFKEAGDDDFDAEDILQDILEEEKLERHIEELLINAMEENDDA